MSSDTRRQRFRESFLSLRPAPWMVGLVNGAVFVIVYVVLATSLNWHLDWLTYLLTLAAVAGFKWHGDFWRKRA